MAEKEREDLFSVAEFADLLDVSKATAYRWLSPGNPGQRIFPADGWFRLPSGAIRIRREAMKAFILERKYERY